MKHARRPPLHPNCRSTLIPVVDLIDPKTGEKIEETAERPAQNADGTYSQVAAKTTFKDYFESQPETFQREWLGEKRFELWKSGKLKFEDLAKPATTYRATTADLTPPTEKPKETAASDDKPSNAPASLADAIRGVGGEDAAAEILRRYAADAKAKAPQSDAPRKAFSPPSAVQDRVDSERDKRIEKFFAANGWTFAPPSKETVDLLRAKIPAKFQPSDAQALMPEKEIRQAVEEGLDFIARIVENSGHSADALADVKISPVLSDGRGEYSNGVATLNGFDFGGVRASVVHEFGHALENLLPGVKAKAVEHYRNVADLFAAPEPLPLEPGEAERLRKQGKPLPVFIPPEKEGYLPDKYAARYYESSNPKKRNVREPRDTEFISRCLEYLINGAFTCETHAEFTADVLRLLKKVEK